MNKLLLLSIIIILFSGCIMPEGEEVITEIIDMTDTYRFHDISYTIEEGDYLRQTEEIMRRETVHRNYTDKEVETEYTFFKGVKDYSVFYGMENSEYTLIKDNPEYILIPASIEGDEGRMYMTSCDYPNLFGESYYPSSSADYKTTYKIDPYMGMDIEYNERWCELRATYTATFIGEKYGRVITITGKWEGKQLEGNSFTGYIWYYVNDVDQE